MTHHRPARRALARAVLLGGCVLALGSACGAPSTGPAPALPTTGPSSAAAQGSTGPAPALASTGPAAGLLQPASGGDGDSWKDTSGREYRLGLVNTPEVGECYAAEATGRRKALVAAGFRAQAYMTDRYGRAVSVVTTAEGVNVNLALARDGYADDRYLERYRAENPGLAAELDVAFAAARRERVGLWDACR